MSAVLLCLRGEGPQELFSTVHAPELSTCELRGGFHFGGHRLPFRLHLGLAECPALCDFRRWQRCAGSSADKRSLTVG